MNEVEKQKLSHLISVIKKDHELAVKFAYTNLKVSSESSNRVNQAIDLIQQMILAGDGTGEGV